MAAQFTGEQQELYNKLTKLQKSVAMQFVANPQLDNAEAHRLAGGKAKNRNAADAAVSRMKKKPEFKAFLKSMNQEIVGEAILTRTKALERLSHIASKSKSDQASISAIRELSEMQGWYAPKKHMEIPAPPGEAKKHSPEDYAEAEAKIDEHFGN